ncbi:hypothetical protein SUGI_1181040 [Cryptomeria japonica]|nr:hypothetical protein SUGI_1181040 [Cryptomeria japonica]
MLIVFLGHIGALDIVGNELHCLVYVSLEKRPSFQHHKRAGAMNALSKQEKMLEGITSSELEWTSFIQSGSEFLEFVNKHIQLEMGDEGNKEAVAQILQSMEKACRMKDEVFEGFCEPRRLGHCKIENKSASLGSYIASANRNTTDQQPIAFSPWKSTYLDHAECWVVFCQVRKQFREIFLEMGFEEMPTNNFVESSWHPKVEETINEFARHRNKKQVSIGSENIVGAEEVTHLEEAALFKTSEKGNVIVLDIFQAKGLKAILNLCMNLMRSLALGNKINLSGSSQKTPKFKELIFLKLGGQMSGLWPVNLECLQRLAVCYGLWPINLECLQRLAMYSGPVFKDGHVLLIC